MIYLEKSELPFSKRPTKNYITHSPEKKDLNHPTTYEMVLQQANKGQKYQDNKRCHGS